MNKFGILRLRVVGGLPLWAALTVLVGCSEGTSLTRVPITGKVQVDGAPLTQGSIFFEPSSGHSGPAALTSVYDGAFSFSTENGPTPGKHTVRITATKLTGAGGTSSSEIKGGNEPEWTEEVDVPQEATFARDFMLKMPGGG
jgi:hypothetical protein